MRSETDRMRLVVRILIAVVVLLAIIVLYLAVFQAQYNNFVAQKQTEGINLFISNYLIPQLQQQGYVSLRIGNQTLYLVPIQPGNRSASNARTSGNTTQ